jgi:hypothetical protein
MNKKYWLLLMALIALSSFQSIISPENIEKVKAEDLNHEYVYNGNGILMSVLTTTISANDSMKSLKQKIVFDSTGMIKAVYVYTQIKEEDGLVHYDDQMIKFDENNYVQSYRFSRNNNRIGGKRYHSSKKRYVNFK